MAWIEQRGTHWRVRYRNPDGTVGTDSSHPTPARAELRRMEIMVDQAHDTYLDPNRGRITLTQWADQWAETHLRGESRTAADRSLLRNHILPRFGTTPINKINRQQVKVFVKDLRRTLADSSVASVMALLSLLLREAVADRRIGFNPCQGVKVTHRAPPERPVATAAQVNRITARIGRRSDQILVITAAYTGLRWGELAGLHRTNTHLADHLIRVDPHVGALHEVAGRFTLGPPKTAASARDIHLPPFLTHLLQEVIDSHDHDLVFVGERGAYLRRSSMSRRIWRPALDGNPDRGVPPIIAGMHFHDLRHTHKTWLIEDDIPEIAQAKRLGHRLPGIRGIYSHVTPTMHHRITQALQDRWTTNQPTPATGAVRGHLRVA